MTNKKIDSLFSVDCELYAVVDDDIYKLDKDNVFRLTGKLPRIWNDIEIRDKNIIINGQVLKERAFEKAKFTDPVFPSKQK